MLQSWDSWCASLHAGRHLSSERAASVLDAQFAPFPENGGNGKLLGMIDNAVLNVRPDPVDFRDRYYEPGLIEIGTTLPPPDLVGLGLAVRNQGAEGSCTGQALGAVIDLQNIARNQAGADVPLRVSARMLYEQARLFDEYAEDRLPGSSAPGMAHWSYEDWSAHVLDAWVLRLQAPVGRPSGFAGGYRSVAKQELKPGAGRSRGSEPNLNILGHYIHLKDGLYSAEPPYASSKEAVAETVHHLTDGPGADKYDHVVFYAHGGINNLENAVARAAAMVDGFKRNRVWPIFYLWRTGLGDVAEDLIGRVWGMAAERAAGLTDLTDTLIEASSRTLVAPFWREMKADAKLNSDMVRGGDGWRATLDIVKAVSARGKRRPLPVHFIGHSAGTILLAEMFARALEDKFDLAGRTGTVSLFAPACDVHSFDTKLKPIARGLTGKREPFAVYNLTDRAEQADSVATLYRKSLLYLVSNAFEERRGTPIAGMDIHMPARSIEGIAYHLAGAIGRNGRALQRQASRSTTHGGFDNDPQTMNHVLARIIGASGPDALKRGFNSVELSSDLF